MLKNTVDGKISLQGTKISDTWKTHGEWSFSNAFSPKRHFEPNFIPLNCMFSICLCSQERPSGRRISVGKKIKTYNSMTCSQNCKKHTTAWLFSDLAEVYGEVWGKEALRDKDKVGQEGRNQIAEGIISHTNSFFL